MVDTLGRLRDYLWMTRMTTAEAADRLHVSQRQVQRMIATGELAANRTAGNAWMVDALTINAMARTRPSRGRPWSVTTAWAALWRLSGLEQEWLDRRTASRLADRLVSLDTEALLHATRRRAVVHHFRASESFLEELAAAVVRTGPSAMTPSTFGMERDLTRIEGYCDDGALSGLVRRFQLADDAHGNVTLRTAPLLSLGLKDVTEMPTAVVAADLAESLEARERAAGLRVLEGLMR
jgi:excisionase family DNA binding protein